MGLSEANILKSFLLSLLLWVPQGHLEALVRSSQFYPASASCHPSSYRTGTNAEREPGPFFSSGLSGSVNAESI